jgi:hypothetical protein
VAATVAETRRQTDEAIQRLKQERAALERQRRDDTAEVGRLAGQGTDEGRLAEIQDRMAAAQRRLADVGDELERWADALPADNQVAAALKEFDGVWDALMPREQTKVLQMLVEQVEFDGVNGNVAINFESTSIKTLGEALPHLHEETAA